jgi:hypothetical protein
MSLPLDVVLTGDVAPTSRTYAFNSMEGGRSIRKNALAPLGEPETLTVAHTATKRGTQSVDRHLVRIDLTKSDVNGVLAVGSVQVVLEVPRVILTAAQIKDMWLRVVNLFATSGYMDKILNSEP